MPEGYNGSRLAREFPGGATPILYVIDGRLRADASLPAPGGKVLKNLEYFGLPVLGQLAAAARLPDLALRYSPYDEADLGGGGRQLPGGSDAAPWFGYCGQRAQRRALLLPDDLLPAGVQCPLGGCQAGPGDAREPRAVSSSSSSQFPWLSSANAHSCGLRVWMSHCACCCKCIHPASQLSS